MSADDEEAGARLEQEGEHVPEVFVQAVAAPREVERGRRRTGACALA
jgi:hypothetical protein